MSYSGIYYNKFTAYDVIRQAFQLIGVIGTSTTESIDDGDINVAKGALNTMIKAWEGQGTRLFQKTEATLFLTKNINSYYLGTTLSISDTTNYAHATDIYHYTNVTTAFPIGTTILAVTSSANMITNDHIAIVLSDASMQWSTIKSIPDSTHVELNNALTGSTSNNARIYFYTNKIQKPLNVYEGRRQNNNFIDTPLWLMTHKQWTEQPNKLVSSTPVAVHYQPKRDYGLMYIWPTANSDSEYRINFTYDRQFQIYDTTLNQQDFPDEWSEAIIYQLAVRLAPRYGKQAKLNVLAPLAEKYLNDIKNFDNEWGSVQLQPAIRDSMLR